jgi:hypothetical protein
MDLRGAVSWPGASGRGQALPSIEVADPVFRRSDPVPGRQDPGIAGGGGNWC